MPLVDTFCSDCEEIYVDVFAADASEYPLCRECGRKTNWMPTPPKTDEWGGPRHYPHLRDEPFGSRSELASWAKAKGLHLGASNDKDGGARATHKLNGTIFSFPSRG